MKKLVLLFSPLVAAVACVLVGQLLIELFPLHIQIASTEKQTVIQIEDIAKQFSPTSSVQAIEFNKLNKNEREWQIDGSESVTYHTFDPAYFATFSATPYYRFQAFLRDDASYNQFANLLITDEQTKRVTAGKEPLDGKSFSLPKNFSLSLDLRRPENEQTISLVHADKSRTTVSIDRNSKKVSIDHEDAKGTVELSSWYFPTTPEPFLAEIMETILNAVAVVFVLMTLLPLLAWYMPQKTWHIRKSAYLPIIFWLAISGMIMANCYISIVLFNNSPYILDGSSYYFQGKIISQGLWTGAVPPIEEAFPLVFFASHLDKWFSTFPPGTALLLAPGFLLHVPWLVEILLTAMTAMLIFFIGEKLYNKTIGTIALILFASSPFVHLQGASFLSHVPALFVATLASYWLVLYLDKPKKRYAILGSLVLGLSGLVREFTPVIYGLAVGGFVIKMASDKYGFKRIYRHIILAVIFGAIGLGCYYLFYNYAYTGSFTDAPRLIANQYDKWGFGDGIGFFGRHTLASGLANTDQQITEFIIYVFGWPYSFAIAFMFIPFLTKRTKPADYLSLAIIVGYVITNIGVFYHGIAFGPRHYFEIMLGFVFLTARGLVIITEYTGAVLHTFHRHMALTRAMYATGLLVVILMLCNVFYFEPRLFQIYKNFADVPGHKDFNVDSIFTNTIGGRQAKVTNAVIMSDNWQIYNTYFAYLNCPTLKCETLYAYASTDADRQNLMKTYPGKAYYLVKQQDNTLSLEPINTAR